LRPATSIDASGAETTYVNGPGRGNLSYEQSRAVGIAPAGTIAAEIQFVSNPSGSLTAWVDGAYLAVVPRDSDIDATETTNGPDEANATRGLVGVAVDANSGDVTATSTAAWTTAGQVTYDPGGTSTEVLVTCSMLLRAVVVTVADHEANVRVLKDGVEIGGLSAFDFHVRGAGDISTFFWRFSDTITASAEYTLQFNRASSANIVARNCIISVEAVR